MGVFLKEKVKLTKTGNLLVLNPFSIAEDWRAMTELEREDWEAGHARFTGEKEGEEYYTLSLHD